MPIFLEDRLSPKNSAVQEDVLDQPLFGVRLLEMGCLSPPPNIEAAPSIEGFHRHEAEDGAEK